MLETDREKNAHPIKNFSREVRIFYAADIQFASTAIGQVSVR
jgi:hypothetical protein